jgi:hypothetical protein
MIVLEIEERAAHVEEDVPDHRDSLLDDLDVLHGSRGGAARPSLHGEADAAGFRPRARIDRRDVVSPPPPLTNA